MPCNNGISLIISFADSTGNSPFSRDSEKMLMFDVIENGQYFKLYLTR